MPLTIPPFVQYQAPIVPLRGLWNKPPPEGDYFVSCEIDWLVSPPGNAVQFSFSGNSPVNLSQIVALSVDNASSGADVRFIFPDSNWSLVVPARTQGVFPVTTNALMFYAIAPTAQAGDETIFLVHNSMPPPVPVPVTQAQQTASISGIGLANGSSQLIAASINGTLNSVSIVVAATASGGSSVIVITLQDGTGRILWTAPIETTDNTTTTIPINVGPLNVRFAQGVRLILSGASNISGYLNATAFYSVP